MGWQSLIPTRAAADSELKRQPNTTDLTTPDSEGGDDSVISTASEACPEQCEAKTWASFIEAYDARGTMPVDRLYGLPFFRRCVATDITMCLRSAGIEDADHWVSLLLTNELVIEPDPTPGYVMCGSIEPL
jgi:hypothetical protein